MVELEDRLAELEKSVTTGIASVRSEVENRLVGLYSESLFVIQNPYYIRNTPGVRQYLPLPIGKIEHQSGGGISVIRDYPSQMTPAQFQHGDYDPQINAVDEGIIVVQPGIVTCNEISQNIIGAVTRPSALLQRWEYRPIRQKPAEYEWFPVSHSYYAYSVRFTGYQVLNGRNWTASFDEPVYLRWVASCPDKDGYIVNFDDPETETIAQFLLHHHATNL